MSHKILRLPSVIDKSGLSSSTIYLQIKKGNFPKSISLGDRAVGWLEKDVDDWLEQKIIDSKEAE